jgi:hypothetical protein
MGPFLLCAVGRAVIRIADGGPACKTGDASSDERDGDIALHPRRAARGKEDRQEVSFP